MRTGTPRISQSVTVCGIRLRFRAFGPWPYLGLSGDQDGERVDERERSGQQDAARA